MNGEWIQFWIYWVIAPGSSWMFEEWSLSGEKRVEESQLSVPEQAA